MSIPGRRIMMLGALVAGLCCVGAEPAMSQDRFPAKPVRIVVPYPAGGLVDILARPIAQRLTESLGQPVLVDNRPGAAGGIGAEFVAKSSPDGHTLLLAVDVTVSVNPLIYSRISYKASDFAPITLVAQGPNAVLVNGNVSAGTIQELIVLAKAQPGKLNYGSFGLGSVVHLEGEAFKAATGTDIVHVPFKGLAEVIPALVSGQIQVVFTSVGPHLAHVKAGRIKVLGVMGDARSPLLPGVPTLTEAGVPGFTAMVWFGLLAPTRTSPEVIRRLSTEVTRTITSAEFREKQIQAYFLESVIPGPEHFAAVLREDQERFGRIIRTLNLKLD